MLKHKWVVLNYLALFVVVILPPLLHREVYSVASYDTAAHLKVFELMKTGNAQYLYFAQEVTGFVLDKINDAAHIPVSTLFMWFSYLSLFISGVVVSILVYVLTHNKLATMFASWSIVFGLGATMQLFSSGTIFNIIDVLVLFPLLLLIVNYQLVNGIKWWAYLAIPAMIALVYFYHPSFGRGIFMNTPSYKEDDLGILSVVGLGIGWGNIVLLAICLISVLRTKIKLSTLIITCLVSILAIVCFIVSSTSLSNYSIRLAMNGSLFLGISMVIVFGVVLNKVKQPYQEFVVAIGMSNIIFNMRVWL